MQRLKIGLALGGGSARGWAHIGVIRALEERGVRPDIVCGSSIGALVGAALGSGSLERLEEWVCALTRFETARFLEFNYSLNGFVDRSRFDGFLERHVAAADRTVESLGVDYAAVATEMETGHEIWLRSGSVLEAVHASIALPGLFPPYYHSGRWLLDGGLVNPVPVSVCRALGADIVIAVNLNGDIVSKRVIRQPPGQPPENVRVWKSRRTATDPPGSRAWSSVSPARSTLPRAGLPAAAWRVIPPISS